MRLNILIISGSLGGVERHTTDILNELSSRDYNIYHIVPIGYESRTLTQSILKFLVKFV